MALEYEQRQLDRENIRLKKDGSDLELRVLVQLITLLISLSYSLVSLNYSLEANYGEYQYS